RMTDATSSASSSSSCANIIQDIIRLIAPSDRPGFDAMLENALRGRELPNDELRRVAVNTWVAFCKHGWSKRDVTQEISGHYSSGCSSSCFMYSTAPSPPHARTSGQIGLRHKASTTARGASGCNLYQGVLQAVALHVAHHMSYRS